MPIRPGNLELRCEKQPSSMLTSKGKSTQNLLRDSDSILTTYGKFPNTSTDSRELLVAGTRNSTNGSSRLASLKVQLTHASTRLRDCGSLSGLTTLSKSEPKRRSPGLRKHSTRPGKGSTMLRSKSSLESKSIATEKSAHSLSLKHHTSPSSSSDSA